MAKNEYFASKEAEKTASILLDKAHNWFNQLNTNGYLEKIRMMWAAYHGAYYTDIGDGHRVTFSGENYEMVNLPVNHLRNLASHMQTMITSNRPALQARATNTDYKSLVQTKLAEQLLDYYLREKDLENYLKRAVEYAIVMGSGYIKMEWNSTTGETYDFNEETKTPVYEGDVEFSNLSPFDVVFDSTKETYNHDWVLCRSFKNKYDLSAKYPEYKDKIEKLATKTEIYMYRFDAMTGESTDDVPVYEFYHKRTESMPDGRYLLFLDEKICLLDGPLPYRVLPIFRISPADILGTPYGYTPLFDILPLQDTINSLYSIIATNQNAFGIQNIYVPRGSDITVSQLVGGLNVIEGNPQAGPPTPLNLTNTPKEVFEFLKLLVQDIETISGINSVARGNPEASLRSGASLALVQSMAIQFISGLQQSYVQLIEHVGTGLINTLKDYASVPRVAAIVGKNNRTFMKEFTGDDLSTVNRVIVDVGNPLSKTVAGRVQMAENLLQYGLLKNPQQFITLINTGSLDALTEDTQTEMLLIKAENESLVSNQQVVAIATDDHNQHINCHKSVLADPDLRRDPELVQRTLSHIQEHIDLMRTTDPDLLQIIGVQPLGPQGGSPATQAPQDMNAGAMGQGDQTLQSPQAGQVGMTQQGGQITGPGIETGVNLPKVPQPPPIPQQ